MKKQYVIDRYEWMPGAEGVAMYETDDFRVTPEAIGGTFEKTKKVKGAFNGHEIGVFHGDNGVDYLVFTDHSARIITE